MEEDRAQFIQQLLFSKKRTFRNFIDNNSNLLRKNVQHQRREVTEKFDAEERRLFSYNSNQLDVLNNVKGAMHVQKLNKKRELAAKHRPLSMSLGL
jgi:hypothetical protein